MWAELQAFGFIAVFEVCVLACVYYYVFLFLQGTRGAQVLLGLGILLAVLLAATHLMQLSELNWLLRRAFVYIAIALLVIFQPEIRRALAELGRQPVFTMSPERRTIIDHVAQAVLRLAAHKIGALVAIEREIGTRTIQETGIKIDAPVVPELLATIFYPHTPLHDGGVIIRGNRIMAAGCVFPLSQRVELHKSLGTRHRAALGLSEETDALVVVVSEETGTISVCYRGRMSRGLDEERLKRFMSALLRGQKEESAWRRMQEQLDLTPGGIAKSETRAKQEAEHGS
jgi:diadenylate cyclase